MKHREGHTQRHHRGSEALIAIMLVVMPCVMDTSSVAEPTTMQRAGAGGPVEFGISAKSTEQGIPIVITIQVNNANTIGEVQLPEGTSSVTMRVLPGSNRSESMSFINGKTSRVVSEFFRIEVTPLVEGTIEIPSISIDVDGSVFSTPLTSIQVSRGVQQEDLASAAVESPDQSIWLGEAIDLTLTIQMRAAPVVDTDSLLDARSMWGCIDVQGSDWGPFTESMMRLIQSNRIPSAEQLPLADGLEYVWRIPVRYFADTAGIPDLSAVSIRIGYPAKVGRQRDMFGTHTAVLQRRPITLTPTIAGLEVKPLPIEGRPDSFTGAVGTFDVIASAKPTSVSAGDPITLDFLVRDTSGRAELASVQPPNLAAAVGMENDFAIPTTKSGGLVKDDVKLFTQTLRPLSEDVRQIPAIPFSWFDPTTDTYCTASTLPLSISVAPSARMDRDSIVGRRLSGNDPTQIASASEKSDSPPVLVPASASLLARQSPRSAWGTALAIAIPPAVFAAFLTIVATRRNAASHPERQRKRDALKVARGALLGGDPERAITGLIEDRLGRPANTLTTKDLGVILVTPETAPLASAARSVMDRCTAARYGGKSIDPSILAETAALLPQLAKALVLTFVLLGAIGTSSACGADSAPDLATLVRAEEAFARGESIRSHSPDEARMEFARAANLYQSVVDEGAANPGIYNNLGTSYAAAGEPARALASYLASQQLDPGDLSTIQAIRTLRASETGRAGNPAWNSLERFSAEWRRWPTIVRESIAVSSWILFWCILGGAIFFRWTARVPWKWCLVPTAMLSVLVGATLIVDRSQVQRGILGVVVGTEAELREGNGLNFQVIGRGPLSPSTILEIIDRRPSWSLVRDPSGREGWIPDTQLIVASVRPE